jgi:tetratricopeptide (TPR) repeat protein
MKIPNLGAFAKRALPALALSSLLLSAVAATAQPQLNSLPTLSNQEREELERLRQEKEIRDRVQAEVDRAFTRTTTLLNTLLLVLTLFPIAIAASVVLLRRSLMNQIISDAQKELAQIQEKFTRQIEETANANLRLEQSALQQEIKPFDTDTLSQINTILTEFQNILEDLKEQKESVYQEIAQLRYAQTVKTPTIIDREIETSNFEHSYQNSELVSDTQSEPVAQTNGAVSEPRVTDTESANQNLDLNANDYLILGNSCFSEGRYLEANQSYNLAVKIEPNFSEARYNNARCYAMQYRINLAVGNLQWAIDIEPRYKEIAKTDEAFSAIRGEELFKQILNS